MHAGPNNTDVAVAMAGLALTYMHMDDLEAGTEALLLKVRRALSLSRALYTRCTRPYLRPHPAPICPPAQGASPGPFPRPSLS